MWIDIIIYTPMYVTFFWAIVLLLSANSRNKARYLLGVFMIAAFLIYLSHSVFFNKSNISYLIFDPIYTFASLSVYPLYFWYIKLLTNETIYNWNNVRFLIPAILLSVFSVVVYLMMSPAEKNLYTREFLMHSSENISSSVLNQTQRFLFFVSRLVFAIQVVYFMVLGRKLVIRYNTRVSNFYSNLESKRIVWVNLLLYSFVITSLMSIIFNFLGRNIFLNSSVLLLIPSGIFSVLLFFIGFQGYMQNHSVTDLIEDESAGVKLNFKEYNNNQLKESLLELFSKEKIYTKSELKITNVSALLKTNRTYVSNLINNEFSVSFSEFVNQYRIEEAKKMLKDKSFKNYSLNFISDTVGFGTLNTFIRVFKESEGITPGKFREKSRESVGEEN